MKGEEALQIGFEARPARSKQKPKNAVKQSVGGLVTAYELERKVKLENFLALVEAVRKEA